MSGDGASLFGKLKEKLVESKRRWAADGRLLTGAPDPRRVLRLPPGQRLVTTWPVICEACFFLSGAGKRSLFEFIQRGAIEVVGMTVADLSRMSELVTKYPDMDFADGTLVLLAEKAGIVEIATVDTRDFAVYRTKDRRAFVNVFE